MDQTQRRKQKQKNLNNDHFHVTYQDRGGEYRSLLGVPGGLSGPMAGPIKEEAAKRGLTLQEGSGADPDTLMRNKVRQ